MQHGGGGGGETKWVIPEKFFDELPGVMKMVLPLPGEESLYDVIQSVLDAASRNSTIKETPQFHKKEGRDNGKELGGGSLTG